MLQGRGGKEELQEPRGLDAGARGLRAPRAGEENGRNTGTQGLNAGEQQREGSASFEKLLEDEEEEEEGRG